MAQIARAIARRLRLDEDLAEALALAHDLGHPPFGHAGEEALDSQMRPYGGFDHNAQSLKVVTLLEARYAAFDGLNLTWETLEGLAKHNGPVRRPAGYLAEYDAGCTRWTSAPMPRPRRRSRRWPTTSPTTTTTSTTASAPGSSPWRKRPRCR